MKLHRKSLHDTDCVTAVRKKNPSSLGKKTGSLKRKLRELRRLFLSSMARLTEQVRKLKHRVNRLSAHVNALQDRVDTLSSNDAGTRAFLSSRVGARLTLETPAGTLFGTLMNVGENFIQLREPDGSIVLLPLRNILSLV